MRQEGSGASNNVGCPGTPVSSSTAGSPNVAPTVSILGDSNSMPSTSMEELHALHHLHSGVSSQVSFSDLYWRRLEMEEDGYSTLSSHLGWENAKEDTDFSFFLLQDDVLVKFVMVRKNNGVGKSMKSLLHCRSINSNINYKYSKENKTKKITTNLTR